MAVSYPSSVKTFTTKSDGVDLVLAAHVNDLQDEVAAIEQGLLNGLAHIAKPLTNNLYDLGTASLKWKDLYLAGIANIGGTVLAAGTSGHVIGAAAGSPNAQLLLTGAFTASALGVIVDVASSVTPAAGSDAYGLRIIPTLVEAGSGTHSFFIGTHVAVPVITAGAAALTNAVSLYVAGSPSAGVNNFALLVQSGRTQFGGDVIIIDNVTHSAGELQIGVVTAAQITSDQNDYNPGHGGKRIVRLSSDASRNVTGLVAGSNGHRITLVNVGSFDIVLVHNSGSSGGANRFYCPGAVNLTLNVRDSVDCYYESSEQKWYVLGY